MADANVFDDDGLRRQDSAVRDFWRRPEGWPQDGLGFTFLHHAVLKIGRALFGADWDGEEPHTFPADRFTVLGVMFDEKEIERAKRLIARLPATKLNADALNALIDAHQPVLAARMDRMKKVKDVFVAAAMDKRLATATREPTGGALTPMPPEWWNSEKTSGRFHFGRINRDRPFATPAWYGAYQWIFVSDEDLAKLVKQVSPRTTIAGAVGRPSQHFWTEIDAIIGDLVEEFGVPDVRLDPAWTKSACANLVLDRYKRTNPPDKRDIEKRIAAFLNRGNRTGK